MSKHRGREGDTVLTSWFGKFDYAHCYRGLENRLLARHELQLLGYLELTITSISSDR